MNPVDNLLRDQLDYLKLPFLLANYETLASEAAQKQWLPTEYLARLIDGETQRRKEQALQRRIAAAHFPAIKTLEQFNWSWPKKINRPQVQNLFRLAFLKDHANIIFAGGVGLGIMPGTGLCRAA